LIGTAVLNVRRPPYPGLLAIMIGEYCIDGFAIKPMNTKMMVFREGIASENRQRSRTRIHQRLFWTTRGNGAAK
jgi:hypothetical protein